MSASEEKPVEAALKLPAERVSTPPSSRSISPVAGAVLSALGWRTHSAVLKAYPAGTFGHYFALEGIGGMSHTPLAVGGFGAVYRATSGVSTGDAIVKIFKSGSLAALQAEARTCATHLAGTYPLIISFNGIERPALLMPNAGISLKKLYSSDQFRKLTPVKRHYIQHKLFLQSLYGLHKFQFDLDDKPTVKAHGDPHLGNFLINPKAQLHLVDFGMEKNLETCKTDRGPKAYIERDTILLALCQIITGPFLRKLYLKLNPDKKPQTECEWHEHPWKAINRLALFTSGIKRDFNRADMCKVVEAAKKTIDEALAENPHDESIHRIGFILTHVLEHSEQVLEDKRAKYLSPAALVEHLFKLDPQATKPLSGLLNFGLDSFESPEGLELVGEEIDGMNGESEYGLLAVKEAIRELRSESKADHPATSTDSPKWTATGKAEGLLEEPSELEKAHQIRDAVVAPTLAKLLEGFPQAPMIAAPIATVMTGAGGAGGAATAHPAIEPSPDISS